MHLDPIFDLILFPKQGNHHHKKQKQPGEGTGMDSKNRAQRKVSVNQGCNDKRHANIRMDLAEGFEQLFDAFIFISPDVLIEPSEQEECARDSCQDNIGQT